MKKSTMKITAFAAALLSLTTFSACDSSQEQATPDVSVTSAAESTAADSDISEETAQEKSDTTTKAEDTEQTNTPAESDSEESAALNSADYTLNVSFTPVYENVGFSDMHGTGSVTSYEDLQDYMESYANISFVGYEITEQYSPDEAALLMGEDIFIHATTLYKAHIYYDYLNDVPADADIYLAKAGLPEMQFEGNPPYAIGQRLMSAMSGYSNTHCVAIPELVYYVYEINGVDFAYHVDNEETKIGSDEFPNLDMDMSDGERSLITTTSNNPVVFTQKSSAEELAEFIRQDWTARGYEFDDLKDFKGNPEPSGNPDEDVPVVE